MAEQSAQERTERPTARRLAKAHDEGQVPRSAEFTTAIVLVSGVAALVLFGGPVLAHGVRDTLAQALAPLPGNTLTAGDATVLLRGVTRSFLFALAPILAGILLPVLLTGGMQARGVLSLHPLRPDFARLSPLKGFQKIFGWQAVFTLFKAIVKLAIIGWVSWLVLRAAWPEITSLNGGEPSDVIVVTRTVAVRLVLYASTAFLALAGLDYAVVLFRHQRQLRMTRQEVIQEFRETEGDPIRKSRMRTLAQALTRRRMMHRVGEADVVIVNPTSIAVAIKYDGASPAPVILAMGRRMLAERIVKLARASNVPIVQNIPVARALIREGQIGKPIPAALYTAVAEVLAYVYRQRGRYPAALAAARGA